ncbi:MAG: diphosphomevalonate decarboxylase [Balneolaceae bacterium]|nr:diphosphomevalonate decarboxylase [Balneolaceae bacterium]
MPEKKTEFSEKPVTAVAHSNIALIKYWGKRSQLKNLPAVGSLSLTLDALRTVTKVQFSRSEKEDRLILNGSKAEGQTLNKVSRFADLMVGSERPAIHVESDNNFPTGAGLASSASGFAALAKAFNEAGSLGLDDRQLSVFARQGSGSAARSIFGGFAEMHKGSDESGESDFAEQLWDENYWDIRLLVAVVSEVPKEIGSTEGMNRTAETSPFYQSWIDSSPADINEMKLALAAKDFEKVGELAEHSAMKMHGLAISANPSIIYWQPGSMESIRKVWGLRDQGIPAYITMDAGPQVKVITLPEHCSVIKKALLELPGVTDVIEAKPGPGAYLQT